MITAHTYTMVSDLFKPVFRDNLIEAIDTASRECDKQLFEIEQAVLNTSMGSQSFFSANKEEFEKALVLEAQIDFLKMIKNSLNVTEFSEVSNFADNVQDSAVSNILHFLGVSAFPKRQDISPLIYEINQLFDKRTAISLETINS